jgi:hypothetical protein
MDIIVHRNQRSKMRIAHVPDSPSTGDEVSSYHILLGADEASHFTGQPAVGDVHSLSPHALRNCLNNQ